MSTQMTRTCTISDAGWPIKYRSIPNRKLSENAENADIEFSMAVLSSAVQARVSVSVYLNQRPHSQIPLSAYVWKPAMSVLEESTRFLERSCASVWHTYICCSHGVVTEARRVGHRLPWQPEGKPFHPAGGISRESKPSSQKTLPCILPTDPRSPSRRSWKTGELDCAHSIRHKYGPSAKCWREHYQ